MPVVPAGDRDRLADWALASAASLLVALAFGVSYGTANQFTYLLSGLRALDPGFLAHDWLAARTHAYHPAFTWVVVAADRLGSVPWVLVALNVALTAATLLLLHGLARRLGGRAALPALLLAVLPMLLDRTFSLGRSYAFASYVQPSAIAGTLLVAAVVAHVAGRWLLSGVLLATSGAFHVNFLLVGLAAFGGAQLLLGLTGLARRVVRQLGPPALVLAANLPTLLAMSSDPGAARSAEIFLFVRSPHHYLPARFLAELIPFVAWQAAAAALWRVALARVVDDERADDARRLAALLATVVALVVGATVVNTVTFVPQLSQLFFWRLAPYAAIVAQLVVALAVVRMLADPGAAAASPCWRVIAGVGAALVAVGFHVARALWQGASPGWAGAAVLAAATLALAGWWLARARAGRGWPLGSLALAGGALLVVAAGPAALAAVRAPDLLATRPSAAAGLHRWAATRTPRDAVFLVPPNLEAFRLAAGRAIVVDWKSTPVLPPELLEWHRRLERVAGRPVRTLADAMAGYAALDEARVRSLADEFAVDYVVVRRRDPAADALARLPEVYRDARYSVRRVAAP